MVGHLHLQAMDESLKGKNRDGLLDSPDSGLPPSPSPPLYAPCGAAHHHHYGPESREGKLLPYLLLNAQGTEVKTRMHPVVYGESIEVNPKPDKELKFSSAVRYGSDRHYRDQVYCAQVPTVTSYSETVVAAHSCTWRSYKSEVRLLPRQRPLHYRTTEIVYPKHARNSYRTTLTYHAGGHGATAAASRWFTSTVRLESADDAGPCVIYAEDL